MITTALFTTEDIKEWHDWTAENDFTLTADDIQKELNDWIDSEDLTVEQASFLLKDLMEYQEEQLEEIEYLEEQARQEEQEKEWYNYLSTLKPSDASYLLYN